MIRSTPLGVHVQMETFTRTDETDEQKSSYNTDVELGNLEELDKVRSLE